MSTDVVWMTALALSRLQEESDRISQLGEAATVEQRARAFELAEILRRAEVGDKPDDGLVEPGMVVTIADADGEKLTFLLGDRALLALDKTLEVEALSPGSPLGVAVDGRHVGDTVTFDTPRGIRTVTILQARPAA